MYLLDTDVLIWVMRGNKEMVGKVSELKEKSSLSISVLSIAEIYKNIFPAELVRVEEYLQAHIIFEVDQRIAKAGGLYWQQYAKKLQNLSLIDCLIAATAQVNNLTAVTLNARHFPMVDIKVLNPLNS